MASKLLEEVSKAPVPKHLKVYKCGGKCLYQCHPDRCAFLRHKYTSGRSLLSLDLCKKFC